MPHNQRGQTKGDNCGNWCMPQRVEDAGGFLEIRNIWGNMSPRRCSHALPCETFATNARMQWLIVLLSTFHTHLADTRQPKASCRGAMA